VGIYVLEPDVIEPIPAADPCDMPEVIDATLAEDLHVGLFPVHEYWLDIGCPAEIERANEDYLQHFQGSPLAKAS
jgi:NDP-sugar pyrophosphorylase family protein